MSLFFTLILGTLMSWAIPHPSQSGGSPRSAAVYLKPYSAVPTGHYNVQNLKKHLLSQQRVRWVYVRSQTGARGWALKHQLLHPLHFSSQARLMAQAPLFPDLSSAALTELTPAEEANVQILDIKNEWVQVRFQSQALWTNVAYLFPIEKDAGSFITRQSTQLYSKPHRKSQRVQKIETNARLQPVKVFPQWLLVRWKDKEGYVPREHVISRLHIAEKAKTKNGFEEAKPELLGQPVFAIYVNPLWLGSGAQPVSLYQRPSVSSPQVGRLLAWDNLLQQESRDQEWGYSYLPDLKQNVWWEIQEESPSAPVQQLSLREIQRTLHNPLFPQLRIASANGLYKSLDGENWSPLRGFQQQNPAFAFAADGALYVEDKISYDNGENFQNYIHWESLFKGLQKKHLSVQKNLKILNIETLYSHPQQIILEIDLGADRPVKAYSADRGKNWSILL